MGTIVIAEEVELPPWIGDHSAFRRWARSSQYPERGKVSYLHGDIWVDNSVEKLIHNMLKTLVTSTWFALASAKDLGQALGDRMMLTNLEAGLSTAGWAVFRARVAHGGPGVPGGGERFSRSRRLSGRSPRGYQQELGSQRHQDLTPALLGGGNTGVLARGLAPHAGAADDFPPRR
jgi:hypothetical protein